MELRLGALTNLGGISPALQPFQHPIERIEAPRCCILTMPSRSAPLTKFQLLI